ncbi:MAG: TraB/GumN family protein, partial [Gemmatimonadaceae bacterium]|nr:TraB/GumN family protein [Acetobacteraceae bacterium]
QVLTRQARAAGKPVRGLETAEQSLAALAGLSDAAALRLLTELIDGRAAETASAMVTPWLAGDLAALGEGMTAKMQREEPEVFRALIVERSARWAEQVAALLEGDGAKLVVVGAGHLAGPENMIDMLASRGIRFDRVPSP